MTAATWNAAAPLSVFERLRFDRLRVFLLVFFTFAMPFTRVFEIGGKAVNFAVADLLLPLGVLWLAWMSLSRGARIPLGGLFFTFVAAICISTLWNLNTALSLRGPASLAIETVKTISLWLYFYLVVNVVESRKDLLLLLKTWSIAGALVSAAGAAGSLAFQYGGIVSSFSAFYRAQGTFEDSNLFAAHAALSMFFTLIYRNLTGSRSLWVWVAVALDLAGILLSASRGSLLATLLSLALVWLLCSSVRAKMITALSIVVLGTLLSTVPDKQGLLSRNAALSRLTTTTVDLDNPEAAQRRRLWNTAFDQFLASPVLGCGRGNFGVAEHNGLMYAHNTYLGLLAETGLLGFLVYMAFGGYALFVLIHGLTLPANPFRTATVLLLGGLLAIALAGVTINIENYRGIWMLMGIVECFRRNFLSSEGSVA